MPNMNLIFLKNIKQVIGQNKYAFFVLILIVLVVVGTLFSSYLSRFFSKPVTKTTSVEKQENLTDVKDVVSKSNRVVQNFDKNVPQLPAVFYGNEVKVKKEVTESDLTEINNRSFIYSVIQYKPEELAKNPRFKNLNFSNITSVKGTKEGTLDEFVSAYTYLLNGASTSSVYSFSLKKLTERDIDLGGDEYFVPAAFSNMGTLYSQVTYGVYLNGNLFVDEYGQSSVSAIYNKFEKTVDFNILNFFPKRIDVVGNRFFEAKNYFLVPKISLDANLTALVLDGNVTLKTSDFKFESSKDPNLVYIYDSFSGLLVPQIAFSGSVENVQGLLNSEVNFMPVSQ